MSFRHELIQVAAVAVAIVQDLDYGTTGRDDHRQDVLDEVDNERYRQEEKWGAQHHTPEEWLAILAEEVGEATQEVKCTDLNTWAMSVSLLDAEVWARKFLKERFGPDALTRITPISEGLES